MPTSAETELTPLRISPDVESARPRIFPSPFDELGPHPLAAIAAAQLQASLEPDDVAEGKVLGVLLVADEQGSLGYLKAFSGKWKGQWVLPGYAPPLFDLEARALLEEASDLAVKALTDQVEMLERAPALLERRAQLTAERQRQSETLAQLQARHHANREQRAQLRSTQGPSEVTDQLSRVDTTEKRQLIRAHLQTLEQLEHALHPLERRLTAAKRLLSMVSAQMTKQIIDLPTVPNARGERRPIAELFDHQAPGGAAECAGPKLLARAYQLGLRPLALSEFWWGATQPSGRLRGSYVPACKPKCGPVLPFMLEGLEVSEPRRVISRVSKESPLRVVYEDQQIRVIEKPEGLLSVSGREASHVDAVETRMPDAFVVHRLDLDTSGLLVLALDQATYVALQQQFSRREVHKRYVALLEGALSGERGTIDLPLRPDVDDRPRQIHDPQRGKAAATGWELISREGARTRVALFPLTGRTHQLRVHCAHPLGLHAPIVGDRLYGAPGPRLMLHCEAVELTQPVTGARLSFEAKAPF